MRKIPSLFCPFFSLWLLVSSLFSLHSAFLFAQIDPSQPSDWSLQRTGIPQGRLARYQIKSRFLKNKRDIWVYTPAAYSPQERTYPLLIVFDGQAYVSDLIPTPTILDNLIANKAVPSLIAVFVSSIDQPSRNRELPCHAPFAAFLAKELLPWVKKNYAVTDRSAEMILAGSSYGGLAAAYAAVNYPHLFGNVLSQSGAFYWTIKDTKEPWLVQQLTANPRLPIRFYMDVGNRETGMDKDGISMVSINRRIRDLLQERGYSVSYAEFEGGHEYECWRQTLPKGLIALTRLFSRSLNDGREKN
ncbi:alpha/beta hydrolase [Candidatus Protochlamydia phocaeensis]|uniref:alpha/beta hydrolase n=1 Tax=Candidatus Protochlamydia phocaeensis TaxID=1414722 RepID=UPI0008383E9B|nr:alpha/beta hydrolase-fold protein [Candidatus Protochlamydia phocaeensis]